MDKRFDTGTPWWKQAGFAKYRDSVKGTLLISIVRDDQLTELLFMAPAPNGSGFDGKGKPEELGSGTPLSVVAARVLAMFAAHHAG